VNFFFLEFQVNSLSRGFFSVENGTIETSDKKLKEIGFKI